MAALIGLLVILSSIFLCQGYQNCGTGYYCDAGYCCRGGYYCCSYTTTYVYSSWWFWIIIVVVIAIKLGIVGCCIYRRNRQRAQLRNAGIVMPPFNNMATNQAYVPGPTTMPQAIATTQSPQQFQTVPTGMDPPPYPTMNQQYPEKA